MRLAARRGGAGAGGRGTGREKGGVLVSYRTWRWAGTFTYAVHSSLMHMQSAIHFTCDILEDPALQTGLRKIKPVYHPSFTFNTRNHSSHQVNHLTISIRTVLVYLKIQQGYQTNNRNRLKITTVILLLRLAFKTLVCGGSLRSPDNKIEL